MDRTAIDYLNYLENSDPYFYKNFNNFIVYASNINKNLKDAEYLKLKEGKESNFITTLSSKVTSLNIIKNFFYKISPNIVRQIDDDYNNNCISFINEKELDKNKSRTIKEGESYKIEVIDTSKIDECFLLVKEYTKIFVENLLDVEEYDRGLKKVYIEAIASFVEFAFAKHLSTNDRLKDDARNYICNKLYDAIYNMNDSYLTLMYLGFLLEEKSKEEIYKLLGGEETVKKLDIIISSKKPCNDYINTISTMLALRNINNCTNLMEEINTYYIKATEKDLKFFMDKMPIDLDYNKDVAEMENYLNNN